MVGFMGSKILIEHDLLPLRVSFRIAPSSLIITVSLRKDFLRCVPPTHPFWSWSMSSSKMRSSVDLRGFRGSWEMAGVLFVSPISGISIIIHVFSTALLLLLVDVGEVFLSLLLPVLLL